MPPPPIRSARLLAIGSELTTGSTQDTNSRELAADLTARGVAITGISVLPDRLATVQTAVSEAIGSADLLVTTGGLGPTPDDLTREAIAGALGVEPHVDLELERSLRQLFLRRGLPMPDVNRKQAWLIPDAVGLPNPNGTAPGWWVERPAGAIVVALPGPPPEMRPMWRDQALPRLEARGVGGDRAVATWRLTGIGESALAELVGEGLLRAADPEVATYARPDGVDLQVSSTGPGAAGRVAATLEGLESVVSRFRFAHGDETWIDALGSRLGTRTIATVEIGTAGQLGALLGAAEWLVFSEAHAAGSPLARAERPRRAAVRVREIARAGIGLCLLARERGGDTAATVAIAVGDEVSQVTRTAFLGGEEGQRRAAFVACAELWKRLGR